MKTLERERERERESVEMETSGLEWLDWDMRTVKVSTVNSQQRANNPDRQDKVNIFTIKDEDYTSNVLQEVRVSK